MASEDHSEPDSAGQSTGKLHAVLASSNRRDVLRYFRDRGEDVAGLEELAEALVAGEDWPDDPAEAAVILHHRTLPVLAETCAFDYDHRSKVMRYRGHERLEAVVQTTRTA